MHISELKRVCKLTCTIKTATVTIEPFPTSTGETTESVAAHCIHVRTWAGRSHAFVCVWNTHTTRTTGSGYRYIHVCTDIMIIEENKKSKCLNDSHYIQLYIFGLMFQIFDELYNEAVIFPWTRNWQIKLELVKHFWQELYIITHTHIFHVN